MREVHARVVIPPLLYHHAAFSTARRRGRALHGIGTGQVTSGFEGEQGGRQKYLERKDYPVDSLKALFSNTLNAR
jgi:hypothetical protein